MKLCRFGPPGEERPGMIDPQGRLRDLFGHVVDIGPATLSAASLAALAAIDPATLPLVSGSPRYGVPVAGTRQFIAIGLNYADHAAESGLAIPAEPVIFTKAVSCLQGPNDPVVIPRGSVKTDWEVELGVVIGKRASYVEEADALSHVAGYCVVDDVSERGFQFDRGGTWDKGKGKRVQDGSTRTMIFGIAKIVAYLSEFMILEPGDIITTGTPPGVGLGQKPEPWYLKAGDVVTLGIEKLGEQRQEFVAWTRDGASA